MLLYIWFKFLVFLFGKSELLPWKELEPWVEVAAGDKKKLTKPRAVRFSLPILTSGQVLRDLTGKLTS